MIFNLVCIRLSRDQCSRARARERERERERDGGMERELEREINESVPTKGRNLDLSEQKSTLLFSVS